MIELQTNPNAPHRVLLTILAEVHELMPSGECRGVVIHKDRKLLQMDGQDAYVTVLRLNELLQEIQSKCQPRA